MMDTGKSIAPIHKQRFKTAYLVKVGLLSAIAFILMYLEFRIPIFFPTFLKMDFGDVPALIAAFAMGPVAGILVQLIKNIFHLLLKSETGGVGPAANFVTGVALVVPAAIIYRRLRTRKGALLGVLVGTAVMTVVMAVANYYVFLPLFAAVYGLPVSAVVAMSAAVNPLFSDLFRVVVFGTAPFNILKGVAVSLVTFFLYKHISPILHK